MSLRKSLIAVLKENNLAKAENPKDYAKLANEGLLLGYPVKINGEHHRPDNGIKYHSTIKFFNHEKDDPKDVHKIASKMGPHKPHPEEVGITPDKIKSRAGDDIYVIKLHGHHADQIKERHKQFGHMGHKENYEFHPHISVDKETHDRIKASGAKTAHEAGIEFGHPELKHGPKTLHSYEPKVKKSEQSEAPPLTKPYSSEAQRRWAHTDAGKKALGGDAGVHEWDEATKGKKLPEKVGKSEELRKSPFVNEDYGQVNLPYHPAKKGKYHSTLHNKANGLRIHRYELPDNQGRIYATTVNGHHKGKVTSQVHVYHNDPQTEEEVPHVAYALTEKGHEGKGLSTKLHQAALKDYGELSSDTRLSPKSNHIWEKLGSSPKNKVKLGDTKGIEAGEARHTATYAKPQKLAASEKTVNKLEPMEKEQKKEINSHNKKIHDYANKIGIIMKPTKNINYGEETPKTIGNTQEYDHSEDSFFPAEHELAHVMMTPHGNKAEHYSKKIPLHSHFITHHLEQGIANRAGVHFEPAHETLDSHALNEHSQEEFENHVLPHLPKGTRNPYREKLPKHKNSQEEYNNILSHFKPEADKILHHFDTGSKFNEHGELIRPNTNQDSKKLAASESLEKGALKNAVVGGAMLLGSHAHAASGHLHQYVSGMKNLPGVKVESTFAPNGKGSKDGKGEYRVKIGNYTIEGQHYSINGNNNHKTSMSGPKNPSPKDKEDESKAKFLRQKLTTTGQDLLDKSLEKGAVKNALTGAAMATALASPHATGAKQHTQPSRAPASVTAPKHSDYSREKMLNAISQVESSGGKNTHHKATSMGTAYGKFAIMPDVVHDTIRLNPDLKRQHQKALNLNGKDLHHYLQDNPKLEQEIVNRHIGRLEHHFGQDPDKISFAWNHGITGTNKALKAKQDISSHPYVQKFRHAYKGSK